MRQGRRPPGRRYSRPTPPPTQARRATRPRRSPPARLHLGAAFSRWSACATRNSSFLCFTAPVASRAAPGGTTTQHGAAAPARAPPGPWPLAPATPARAPPGGGPCGRSSARLPGRVSLRLLLQVRPPFLSPSCCALSLPFLCAY